MISESVSHSTLVSAVSNWNIHSDGLDIRTANTPTLRRDSLMRPSISEKQELNEHQLGAPEKGLIFYPTPKGPDKLEIWNDLLVGLHKMTY